MAEYRGLTIRINADTSRLSAALKATQSAISSTQKNLNQLKKALDLDPGNSNAAALYINELASQAVASASKVAHLREEIESISKSTSSMSGGHMGTIGDLAKETEDAALAAQRAKAEYNDVTDALASIYGKISEISHEKFDLSKDQIKGLNDRLKEIGFSSEKAKELLKGSISGIRQELSGIVAKSDETAAKIRRITEEIEAYKAAGSQKAEGDRIVAELRDMGLSATKARQLIKGSMDDVRQELALVASRGSLTKEEMEGLLQIIEQFKHQGITFNVENSGLEEIEAELNRLVQSGELTQDEMDETMAKIRQLKTAWKSASESYSDAQLVEQLHNDEVEVAKLEAAIKDLARQMVEASEPSDLAKGWSEAQAVIDRLSTDVDRTRAHFEALDESAKLNPENIDVAERRTVALQEAIILTEAKAEALNAVLDDFKSQGMDGVAASTLLASENVERTRAAFQAANEEVLRLRSEHDRLQAELSEISVDEGEMSDAFVRTSESASLVREQLVRAEEAAEAANEEYRRASDASTYKDVESQVDNARLAAEKLRDAYRQIAELDVRAMKGSDTYQAWERTSVTVKTITGDLSTANREAESFSRLMQADPSSISAVSGYVEALARQLGMARERSELLNSTLEDFKSAGIDSATAQVEALERSLADAYARRDALLSAHEQGGAWDRSSWMSSLNEIRQIEKQLEDARQAASEASTSYSEELRVAEQAAIDAAAKVSDLTLQLTAAKAKRDELTKSADVDMNTDAIKSAEFDIRALEGQLRKAEEAAANANEEFSRAKDRSGYAQVRQQAAEAEAEVTELRNKYVMAIQEISRSTTAVNLTPVVSGLSQAKESLGYLSTEADQAVARFEVLDKALDLKPHSISLARERMAALKDATEATREKADKLREIIQKYKDAGIDKVLESTKNLSESVAKAHDYFDAAKDSVTAIKAEITMAENKMDELKEAGKDNTEEFSQLEQKVEGLREELEKAEAATEELGSEMKRLDAAADMQGAIDGLNEATEAEQRLKNEAKNAASTMSTSMFMALQEIGQFGRQAISEVSSSTYELEDAYTNMLKTVEGTQEEYEALKDAAIEASLVNPVSAAQILNVEAMGGQLGFTIEHLEEFQRVANGLQISTNMTWEEASTNLARFFNLMGTGPEELGNYGSAIVDLGNHFATTESEISDMALRIAGVAGTMNMSEADVLGLAAALTSVGLSAEAGGSSITQIMAKVDKAVANGTDGLSKYASETGMTVSQYIEYLSGLSEEAFAEVAKAHGQTAKGFRGETLDAVEQLKTWADTAGMTSEAFVKAWKDKPIEALQALFSHMDEAAKEGSNLNLMLEELGITTIRQTDVARRAVNAADLVTDAIATSNRAYEENIALDVEVERRNQSLSGRMDVLGQTMNALKTEMGEGLAPIVGYVTEGLQGLYRILDKIGPNAKAVIIGATGLTTGLAAALPVIDTLRKSLLGLTATKTISQAFAAITTSVASLGKGLIAGITSPAGMAIVALGALAGGLYFLKTRNAEARKEQDAFNEALSNMRGYANGSAESAAKYAESIKPIFDSAYDAGKSVKELTDQINAHNDAMKSIQTEHDKDATLLRDYQQVIEDTMSAWNDSSDHGLTVDQMSELEWAIDGINQQLGTNITLEQVLSGEYENENGEIQNTIEYLNQLIDAREREALAQANQQILTEARKNQYDMDLNLRNAERELADSQAYVAERTDELMDSYKKLAEERGQTLDDATLAQLQADSEKQAWEELGTSLDELQRNYDAAATAAGYAADEVEYAHNNMTNSAALAAAVKDIGDYEEALHAAGLESDALAIIAPDSFKRILDESGGDINKIVAEVKDYNDALTNNAAAIRVMAKESPEYLSALGDIDLTEFSESLDDAGVKVADLERIGSEKFAELVNESGGNLDTLTTLLDLAAMELDDTSLAVSKFADEFPEYGLALDQANVGLNEFAQKCEEAGITTDQIRAIGSDNFNALCKACNGDVDKIIEKIEEFNRRDLEDKDVQVTASGNIISGDAEEAVRRMIDWQSRLYDKTVWWTANVKVQGDLSTAGAYAEKFGSGNAAGGIRFHAYGGIVDRPSWLGTRDIVGEAGAEAIIPLTNRKYVSPFADTVAEELLQKMGTQGGDNITIQLNYEAGTDANQMVRELARGIQMHKATKGRW